ncbi:sulfite exporter TauE/SafE family protein 5-like [Euphorbia lathyris]|uniref:sulfite exporter TauE/SafE family protein 5-like n=1 Tax=Euphorbia lathyris TaxID=212925 RepID=UPI0033139CA4
MKILTFLPFLTLSLSIFTISTHTQPQPQPQPTSNPPKTPPFLTTPHSTFPQSTPPSPPLILPSILCFAAASISSAGGIGGGGLFIPILTIVASLDLKTASAFSAFMVTASSVANVIYHVLKFGGKKQNLIDFDIALLSQPCMMLGVSVGVICNVVFPEWIITILFVGFLGWCTLKTCRNGVLQWRLESEEGNFENGGMESVKVCFLSDLEEVGEKLGFPWMKFGVLILIWFCFSFVYVLRGNRYGGEGTTITETCGVGYWVLSSLQIPLAIIFTAWILITRKNTHNQTSILQDTDVSARNKIPQNIVFPLMALLAGILGGVFGIGGGMLISPLLLHVGIPPEVTAATCSFMVFFSSSMSAFQYSLSGIQHTDTVLVFAAICFVASLIGLLVVQRAIQEYGRASIIVFSVSIVMALSTVLITSFGAIDVWRNYQSGTDMGFKFPC